MSYVVENKIRKRTQNSKHKQDLYTKCRIMQIKSHQITRPTMTVCSYIPRLFANFYMDVHGYYRSYRMEGPQLLIVTALERPTVHSYAVAFRSLMWARTAFQWPGVEMHSVRRCNMPASQRVNVSVGWLAGFLLLLVLLVLLVLVLLVIVIVLPLTLVVKVCLSRWAVGAWCHWVWAVWPQVEEKHHQVRPFPRESDHCTARVTFRFVAYCIRFHVIVKVPCVIHAMLQGHHALVNRS